MGQTRVLAKPWFVLGDYYFALLVAIAMRHIATTATRATARTLTIPPDAIEGRAAPFIKLNDNFMVPAADLQEAITGLLIAIIPGVAPIHAPAFLRAARPN